MLVDWEIENARIFVNPSGAQISIDPYHRDQLQPASYDMLLADEIARVDPRIAELDPRIPGGFLKDKVSEEEGFLVHPGEFILASSVETFGFDNAHVGQISGKSSLARLGLQIETAGYFDPGFKGQATLELANQGERPIRLYPGMKIAQMVFFKCSSVLRPYGSAGLQSKYQGQTGPTFSRAYQELSGNLDTPQRGKD